MHLVDGTYELFRHFFAVPAAAYVNGQEVGAVRGVLTSVLSMMVTTDIYTQAVTSEKRKAQSRVVGMIVPRPRPEAGNAHYLS